MENKQLSEFTKSMKEVSWSPERTPMAAYEQPHIFTLYKIGDDYDTWQIHFEDSKPPQAINDGPVFPYFLEADFLTYKGFREFTNLFGFDGIRAFSPRLEKRLKSESAKGLSKKFLMEEVWPESAKALYVEQDLMNYLHKFLFEEDVSSLFKPGFEPKGIERLQGSWAEALTGVGGLVFLNLYKKLTEITLQPANTLAFIKKTLETGAGWWKGKEAEPLPLKYVFPSIVSRCYLELIHAFNKGKKPKPCANCGRLFLPDRANEKYCGRLDPDASVYTPKQTPTLGRVVVSTYRQFSGLQLEHLTCRARGGAKKWKASLTKAERAYQVEQKRRLNHLNYFKRKDDPRYTKAKEEYDQWLKANQPKTRKGR